MNVIVNIDIPFQRIADLMVTAIECNHMTAAWCAGIHLTSQAPAYIDGEEVAVWYARPRVFESDFKIEVKEVIDERKPLEGDNLKVHVVDVEKLCKGFGIMAAKEPKHFADVLAEDFDAITADVFLQCVALGEVVYG